MKLKFIQVNIYKGKYLDELVDFINNEKPDFVSMQEVTVGGFNFYSDKSANLFDVLRERLGMDGRFHGDLQLAGESGSVFGNAVFSKWPILGSRIVELKKFRPVTIDELDSQQSTVRELIDRHLLDCEVDFNGKNMHILSWHGAWTAPPQDTDETWRQANLVYNHLKSVDRPFILGGDLNAIPEGKTVNLIEQVANNLMKGANVSETTNLEIHKIAPMGFLVDYIFTSPDIKCLKVTVPKITVSDHLPVVAELETAFS